MTDRHLGFRVIARSPQGEQKVDEFALRQAAIECVRLLHAEGWKRICCMEVIEEWIDDVRIEQRWPRVNWRDVQP